jgi:hypothetical protein
VLVPGDGGELGESRGQQGRPVGRSLRNRCVFTMTGS